MAMFTLLPLSLSEAQRAGRRPVSIDDLLFNGLYPPVQSRSLDPKAWYRDYVRRYLERDLRQIVNVRNPSTFYRFLALCAARTGQLLNLSSLAADAGVSHTTARMWLGALEATYIVHLLSPHSVDFGRRIIKTPKLYFYDSGLAAHLLQIGRADDLAIHAQRWALFETWVVSEFLKYSLHRGKRPKIHFWRDRTGNEVDLVIQRGETLIPIEIKSGKTVASDFAKNLRLWQQLSGEASGPAMVIYGGDESFERDGIRFLSWGAFAHGSGM